MRLITVSTAILATIRTVSGHASMIEPKPINFDLDPDYNAPLAPGFSNFPCKGYHREAFQATAQWKAGQDGSFTLNTKSIAAHGGGSCQASISHDGGKTFQVLHSFIGDCPRAAEDNKVLNDNQTFTFKIPEDEPAGEAIFAWTWFNTIGRREMYMNCAFVTIENDNPVSGIQPRPAMFVGTLSKDESEECSTPEGTNLEFPDPGPFVTDGSQTGYVQHKGKTLPSGPGCGDAASGGGQPVHDPVPPNSNLVGGGPIAGPKPGPVNPVPVLDPTPTPTEIATTMMTSVMPSEPTPPANDDQKVVYVTEVVTHPVIDIVTVTATTYITTPTDSSFAKRHEHAERDESCSFREALKIGNECPVPSTTSSQWENCVWKEFCPCLDDNLSPLDITNFSQVKGHCDCVTKGIGCPAAVRTRHMRRHTHSTGVDIILRKRDDQMVHTFRL
ncbi:hypothetical protein TWF730_011341 [Orbilia blumenaviensis]|uniref:Lytic polysaccharide monooxygenase n=1 Tax=Orbilia blumenaviensis TaxID=1796055 RepID=A0AAV9ULP6_9PEZI